MKLRTSFLLVAALSATFASATLFTETEPNDTLATGTIANGFAAGDQLQGNSVASTGVGVDYFHLNIASTTLGIYRHTLTINSQTAGHSATIRGLNQTSGTGLPGTIGTTETSIQSNTITPTRSNTWFGFGKGEFVDYRVTGTASTTADYLIDYSVTQVIAANLGNIDTTSALTFSTRNATTGTLDTDFWIYDANLDPVAFAGNDDSSVVTTSAQSDLTRTLGPGTYYIAMSRFNLAVNSASPADDDFRTGAVTNSSLVLGSSTTATDAPYLMTIGDGVNTLNWNGTLSGGHAVEWATFTVSAVPEPTTMAVGGLIVAALAARRKRKQS